MSDAEVLDVEADADRPGGSNARGRATRGRLLEAASACFGERGYAAVRVSDVTERAGISHGAFYRHFRDKGDLLLNALREPLEELLCSLRGPAGGVVDTATVQATTTAFFAVYARHRQVLRVLRELAAPGDHELAGVWLEVRQRYLDRVGDWVECCPAPATGPDRHLLAEALGSVLDQLAYTRLGLAVGEVPDGEVERLGAVAAHVWLTSLGRAVEGDG